MLYLKADTVTEVTIGPVVAVGDGFTPVTTMTIAGADEAEIIKHGATTTTAITGTVAAITGADGYYSLDLVAGDVDTEGRLVILINDDSLMLPVRHEFMVVNANVYDSLFAAAATDYLQTDLIQINGAAQTATLDTVKAETVLILADTAEIGTAGAGLTNIGTIANVTSATLAATTHTGAIIPTVNSITNTVSSDVVSWLGTAAATPTTAGVPEVDITYVNGAAVSASTAQLGVNVVNWKGTAAAAVNTAGYPVVTVKDGTGTGEINTTSGVVEANVAQILGNATSATNLSASTQSMAILTVNTGNVASTTTTAQFTGSSEATADHFIGRKLFFYDSGDALFLQGTSITDSSWDAGNSEVVLTFQQLTEAPSDGDVAILV